MSDELKDLFVIDGDTVTYIGDEKRIGSISFTIQSVTSEPQIEIKSEFTGVIKGDTICPRIGK